MLVDGDGEMLLASPMWRVDVGGEIMICPQGVIKTLAGEHVAGYGISDLKNRIVEARANSYR